MVESVRATDYVVWVRIPSGADICLVWVHVTLCMGARGVRASRGLRRRPKYWPAAKESACLAREAPQLKLKGELGRRLACQPISRQKGHLAQTLGLTLPKGEGGRARLAAHSEPLSALQMKQKEIEVFSVKHGC
jgi:hypothetical protein